MAKEINQKGKLLVLLRLLWERTDEAHGMTAAQLLDALAQEGISAERKSLYSDLETLRQFGMDVEKRQGKTTEYALASRDFELPELKLLVDAVQSSRFITKKKTETLIRKLERLTSNYEARQLSRQVYVSNRVKSDNERIYYGVDRIHAAISENRQIRFQYFEWNAHKQRVLRHDGAYYQVSPWALSWTDENYYLVAYDAEAQKIKHYRVDKMLNISQTEEKRLGEQCFGEFDMAVYSRGVFGMYGGEETLVTLRCADHLAGVMLDRFGHDINILPQSDGTFLFSVRIQISPLFLTWLMNFGDGVRVESPQSVIDRYTALARQALEQYAEL